MWHLLHAPPESDCCADCRDLPVETCGICFDTCTRIVLRDCSDHAAYCVSCIGLYVGAGILQGKRQHMCPHPGCGRQLLRRDFKQLRLRGQLSESQLRSMRELENQDRAGRLDFVLSGEDPLLTEWAQSNTQSCPGCYTIVQRTEGCSHMTCSCGRHFCYYCGEDINHHNAKECPGNLRAPAEATPRLSAQGRGATPSSAGPPSSAGIW